MKLTAEQVKSFFYDDNTMANTDEFELLKMNTEVYGSDDSRFTLVLLYKGTPLMGETMVFGNNESGYEWPTDFDGIELKEAKAIVQKVTVWEYV